MRLLRGFCLLALLTPLASGLARAADPVIPLPTPVPAPSVREPSPPPTATPSDPAPATRTRFVADPITDFGLIGLSLGFSATLEAIIGTGELTPQQPVDKSQLLGIDRFVVRRTVSKSAPLLSNLGLFAAGGYAVIYPVVSAYRFGGETGLIDGIMFAESVTLAWSATNLAKIAVRRPRPLAYQLKAEQDKLPAAQRTNITGTDTALSFFSGHAAITSAIGATATYMAFTRSPGTAWPWITLGVSTAVTTFVSYERVAAGKHFPTDVFAGVIAGSAIGLIVPHLHREQTLKQRPVWVGGYATTGGGQLSVEGLF